MDFLLPLTFAPMEAESVEEIPAGPEWQYEPKWDGFRCLAFKQGSTVELRSKSGQPLGRYFPDVVESVAALPAKACVIDGELTIPVGKVLSFDDLQLRLHPAESRVKKLAAATPAWMIVFDLLATAKAPKLFARPLSERRKELETFAAAHFEPDAERRLRLSPATPKLSVAKKWFGGAGGALDGLIAKRLDLDYRSGERDGMVKIKPRRTADCVVGGFRYGTNSKTVGSLLLGLYDDEGLLNHVGFCSSIKAADREALTKKLEKLAGPPGFTGRAPGVPSRWSTERSTEWTPLKPKLVVEITFDHVSGERFRHGTGFLRWRPDKTPEQCTMAQLHQKHSASLASLLKT